MIAFDNGPAHGDYVRYIDDLMKRGAIASTAGVLPPSESGSVGPTRDRLVARSNATDPNNTVFRQDGARTGFAAPAPPTAGASAAAAIAAALAGGQTGRALPIHTKVGFAAIVLGIVLIVVGLIAPLNVVVVVGGGALIAWAVRMMRDAAARA